MSRSAVSMAAVWPTRVRPASPTASGLSTFEFGDSPAALADRVLDEPGDDATGQFVDRAGVLEAGMKSVDLSHQALDIRNGGAKLVEREQTGAKAIVDVVGVIGNIVCDRSRLRLEARMEAELQALHCIVAEDGGRDAPRPVSLRRRARGVEQRPVVLDEARQRRLGQVEAVELGVMPLELGHDAQSVAVVVEAAVLGHTGVEGVLAGMPEGGVAEIVAERDRFREIIVEPQGASERARDLRHLDRVGETGAEMVALVIDEHLGLVGETAEGGRMDDAVAVALEVGPRRRGRLGDKTRRPTGVGGVRRAGRQAGIVRHRSP